MTDLTTRQRQELAWMVRRLDDLDSDICRLIRHAEDYSLGSVVGLLMAARVSASDAAREVHRVIESDEMRTSPSAAAQGADRTEGDGSDG